MSSAATERASPLVWVSFSGETYGRTGRAVADVDCDASRQEGAPNADHCRIADCLARGPREPRVCDRTAVAVAQRAYRETSAVVAPVDHGSRPPTGHLASEQCAGVSRTWRRLRRQPAPDPALCHQADSRAGRHDSRRTAELAGALLTWCTRFAEDHYAEYWDAAFLSRLNLDDRSRGSTRQPSSHELGAISPSGTSPPSGAAFGQQCKSCCP